MMTNKKPKSERRYSMDIPRPMAEWLRVIADWRDINMVQALDKFGGPAIAREYRKCVEEMHKDAPGGES